MDDVDNIIAWLNDLSDMVQDQDPEQLAAAADEIGLDLEDKRLSDVMKRLAKELAGLLEQWDELSTRSA